MSVLSLKGEVYALNNQQGPHPESMWLGGNKNAKDVWKWNKFDLLNSYSGKKGKFVALQHNIFKTWLLPAERNLLWCKNRTKTATTHRWRFLTSESILQWQS